MARYPSNLKGYTGSVNTDANFETIRDNIEYPKATHINEAYEEIAAIESDLKTYRINVKHYGAVGDGSTNDTTAINAALAVANPISYTDSINTLYFPQGVYKITPGSLTAITCNIDAAGAKFVSATSTDASLLTLGWESSNPYGHYTINIGVLEGYNFSFGNNTYYGKAITWADNLNDANDRWNISIGQIQGFTVGLNMDSSVTNTHLGSNKIYINSLWCCTTGVLINSGDLQIENNVIDLTYVTWCKYPIRLLATGSGLLAITCQNVIRINCLELHQVANTVGINLYGATCNQNIITVDSIFYDSQTDYIVYGTNGEWGNLVTLPEVDWTKMSYVNSIIRITGMGVLNSAHSGRSVFYGAGGGQTSITVADIGDRYLVNDSATGEPTSYYLTSDGWKIETTAMKDPPTAVQLATYAAGTSGLASSDQMRAMHSLVSAMFNALCDNGIMNRNETPVTPPGYYVDYDTGSDSNPGTSDLPWKYCPGMTGWTGSTTLSGSDILYFKNDVTWPTSGAGPFLKTTADDVEYDGSTWGGGTRAKFEANVSHESSIIEIIHNSITMTGFDVSSTNSTNNSALWINGGPNSTKSISNISVSDCVFHDLYYGTGNLNTNPELDFWCPGVKVGSVGGKTTSTVLIEDCTIYNTVLEGLVIYPTNDSGATNNHVSDVTVRHCTIYNSGKFDEANNWRNNIQIKNWVTNATIEFCTLYQGTSGILISYNNSVPTGHEMTGIKLRYNIIKDTGWGLVLQCQETYTGHCEVDTYGNIFYDNGWSTEWGGTDVYFMSGKSKGTGIFNFYNNTFYSIGNTAPAGSRYCIYIPSGATGTPTIRIKNNIFYTDDHSCVYDAKNWILTNHNNNMYYRTSASGDQHTYINGSSKDRTATATWEATAYVTDPGFSGTLPTGFSGTYGTNMIPNQTGLALSSGNAIDHGDSTLGSTYSGAINLSGTTTTTRTGTWDIGAYEYVP